MQIRTEHLEFTVVVNIQYGNQMVNEVLLAIEARLVLCQPTKTFPQALYTNTRFYLGLHSPFISFTISL